MSTSKSTSPKRPGKNRVVAAHKQAVTNHYVIRYPAHPPRESDPHYRDFEEYRRRTRDSAECHFAVRRGGDRSECGGGLELHHAHIEFSMQNGIDLALLEEDYPGVSTDDVGAWVESAKNLLWYCEVHHRSDRGVHHLSAADFEASHYVRNLIV